LEKVKLPRSVAEALDFVKVQSVWSSEIIKNAFDAYKTSTCSKRRVIASFADKDAFKFCKAIMFGYEVEETPEEKLRKWFKDTKVNGYPASDWQIDGAVHALNTLGIKIEGVNA
jgi:hypothetical protein